jgi:hypothetical protein
MVAISGQLLRREWPAEHEGMLTPFWRTDQDVQ